MLVDQEKRSIFLLSGPLSPPPANITLCTGIGHGLQSEEGGALQYSCSQRERARLRFRTERRQYRSRMSVLPSTLQKCTPKIINIVK